MFTHNRTDSSKANGRNKANNQIIAEIINNFELISIKNTL
jgi:hypothetical protein